MESTILNSLISNGPWCVCFFYMLHNNLKQQEKMQKNQEKLQNYLDLHLEKLNELSNRIGVLENKMND